MRKVFYRKDVIDLQTVCNVEAQAYPLVEKNDYYEYNHRLPRLVRMAFDR